MARDEIFRRPRPTEPFRFDGDVADVFDDMLRRSIPGYDALAQLVGVAARRYCQDGTRAFDLGCSLGTATLAIRHGVRGRSVHITAIDQSQAMVDRCRTIVERDGGAALVEVLCDDASSVAIEGASLVVMNFTLQFIDPAARSPLLRRIYDGLIPGGALVLSEKLSFAKPEEAELMEGLHDEFRRENGYSDLEISQKRNALENVLVCDSRETQEERLRAVGFEQAWRWYRCLNFASWLALK